MSQAKRYSQVGKLFLEACDLSATDRMAYLDKVCPGDSDIRAEVESLLKEDSLAEGLLSAKATRLRLPSDRIREPFERMRQLDFNSHGSSSLDFSTAGVTPPESAPNISGYQITGIVGQGGMGVVYRALEINLDREVALKVLPVVFGQGKPASVERFRREAAAAARLCHKNIVGIYDFGQSNGHFYYTMELVEGAPLNEVIRRLASDRHTGDTESDVETLASLTPSPLPSLSPHSRAPDDSFVGLKMLAEDSLPFHPGYFKLVASWLAGVAEALQVAHENGIVHRDIKPGNLILSRDNKVMITDFGLAYTEYEETITRTGAIMGTLRYLSPELALGSRVPVDHRTDIYSLGATLYELLTLGPIFSGVSESQLLATIIGQEPLRPTAINAAVPADLETICLKALEKRPAVRYATAEEFAADLRAYAGNEVISARRPSLPTRLKKAGARHKLGLVAGLAVVLLVYASTLLLGARNQALVDQQVGDLVSRGLVLQKDHRWDDASDTYLAAIKLDANNVRALGNLAIMRKEQFETKVDPDSTLLVEANDFCDRALAVSQKNAGLWNVKGVIQKKLGEYDNAIESYQMGLAIDGASTEMTVALLDNLAESQWLIDDTQSAEASLRSAAQVAAETNTPVWFIWQDLASLELAQGDVEAANSIQRAFDAKSEPNWRLRVTRARIHLTLDEVEDIPSAVRDAYAAVEEKSRDPRVARVLALAMLRSEDYEEATLQAQHALELGDLAAYDHLIAAISHAKQGQTETAIWHLNAAREAWPTALIAAGYKVSTQWGMLWFDTSDELMSLWAEAESVIYDTP